MNDEENTKDKDKEVTVETDSDLDDSVVAEENATEAIKKLRVKLKAAEGKASEYLNGWQRSQADFINFKKRQELEKQEFLKYAAEPILTDILHALNDFEAAFQNEEWQKADKIWREGMERIFKRFIEVLAKHGVKRDNPNGQDFDPSLHLAVATVQVKNKDEDGKVLGVIHSGYHLNGRVIQPAKVKVGKFE